MKSTICFIVMKTSDLDDNLFDVNTHGSDRDCGIEELDINNTTGRDML